MVVCQEIFSTRFCIFVSSLFRKSSIVTIHLTQNIEYYILISLKTKLTLSVMFSPHPVHDLILIFKIIFSHRSRDTKINIFPQTQVETFSMAIPHCRDMLQQKFALITKTKQRHFSYFQLLEEQLQTHTFG